MVIAFLRVNNYRMWLKNIQLKNCKSFVDSGVLEFSSGINLLVGPNNAGKSIIIRAISVLQPLPNHPDADAFLGQSLRHGSTDCEVTMELKDPNKRQLKVPDKWDIGNWPAQLRFARSPRSASELLIYAPNGNFQPCPNPICYQKQPENFLYTYSNSY